MTADAEQQPGTPDGPESGSAEQHEQLTDRPSIWAGSWLDYNNGVLHGQWIDAARDDDAIWQDIQAMLAASPTAHLTGEPAEDWGVFDYEGFGPLRIGESETVTWIGTVARGIAEHGLAFAAYADVMEDEQELAGFSDDYLGQFDSVEAYAAELADDFGYQQLIDDVIPESLRPYVRFDIGALARDIQAGGDIHVIGATTGGVWIFRSQ